MSVSMHVVNKAGNFFMLGKRANGGSGMREKGMAGWLWPRLAVWSDLLLSPTSYLYCARAADPERPFHSQLMLFGCC